MRWHEKDRENFVSRLGQLAAETDTGIFAWTLMTNHAHILIKIGSFRKFRTGP